MGGTAVETVVEEEKEGFWIILDVDDFDFFYRDFVVFDLNLFGFLSWLSVGDQIHSTNDRII